MEGSYGALCKYYSDLGHSDNPLRSDGGSGIAFAEILCENKTLTSLNLGRNLSGPEAAKALFTNISQNKLGSEGEKRSAMYFI
ncbi:hypothetical protein F8M41_022343 [Gigaspora margarita]|uniref:Uncharacterized protein n=1 Tax=Gigaspora margarita TaxID=4874 RepID=A0A8H4AF86_GIGMA|nr:hypothetical protein F8M41_022343 [Gigaspora margarita]